MDGFGSHTYSLWNNEGERYYVKWHFKTAQGIENLTTDEAGHLASSNPDHHREHLFNLIENDGKPKWTVKVQVMPESDAETYEINPFDLTKVWPHKDYPLIEVGELELNRNPANHFAEVEQAAFSPGNMPPGIGASPDRMLQARMQAYPDAQRYRVGVNHGALDVNKPRCPVHHYHRDGQGRFDGNGANTQVYQPNSFNTPADDASYAEPALKISGNGARHPHQEEAEHFKQVRQLFKLMNNDEQQRLINNIAAAMYSVPIEIQARQVELFSKVDPDLGMRIHAELNR